MSLRERLAERDVGGLIGENSDGKHPDGKHSDGKHPDGKHSDGKEDLEECNKEVELDEEEDEEETEGNKERAFELPSHINFNKSHIKCAVKELLKTISVHFLTFIGINDKEFNKVRRPDTADKIEVKKKEFLTS